MKVTDYGSLTIKKNKVKQAYFNKPNETAVLFHFLEGAIVPCVEVEHDDWLWLNRRFMQGENSIKLVESILDIDCELF